MTRHLVRHYLAADGTRYAFCEACDKNRIIADRVLFASDSKCQSTYHEEITQ